MTPKFDLLIEPWIPVIKDGNAEQMSLREVLYTAHQVSGLFDPLLTVEYGLYRFLVALTMDIYNFTDIHDLETLLNEGMFDQNLVDKYFYDYSKCFDLFDSERPFLQTANVNSTDDKPVSSILACIPSGTNATHFHHFNESDFTVSPAVGARLLTMIAPFMTAGGSGLSPSINGAPPWYVLINGDNLFQTIVFNCYVGDPQLLGLTGTAPAAWRNTSPPKSSAKATKASLMEALTWRPRTICYLPSGPGRCSISGEELQVSIRKMKFFAGASVGFQWIDPSVPYKISKDSRKVIRPQEDRDLWRDTGPLALLNQNSYGRDANEIQFSRPRIIDQLHDLYAFEQDKPNITLSVYGIRTDMKTKVFEWQKETLTIPTKLVINSRFAMFAQECMDEASKVEYALKKSLKHLVRDDGKSNTKALNTLINNAVRQYWAMLRPEYFLLLNELASLPKEEHAEAVNPLKNSWRQKEGEFATRLYDEYSEDMDTYGDNIQRQVEGRLILNKRLRTMFEPSEQKDARKPKTDSNTMNK